LKPLSGVFAVLAVIATTLFGIDVVRTESPLPPSHVPPPADPSTPPKQLQSPQPSEPREPLSAHPSEASPLPESGVPREAVDVPTLAEFFGAAWTDAPNRYLGKLGRGAGVRIVEWTLANPTDRVRHLATVGSPHPEFVLLRTIPSAAGGLPKVEIHPVPIVTPIAIAPRERFTVRTTVNVAQLTGAKLSHHPIVARRRLTLAVQDEPARTIELVVAFELTDYLVYDPDPKLFLKSDDARLPFGRRSEATIDWKVRRGDRAPFRVLAITRQPRGFEVTTEPASPDLAEWWIRLRAVDVQRKGAVQDWIRFQTDTAQEGEIYFAGTIAPPITVTPADIVRFDDLVRGAPARAELRVEGPPGKDLRDVVAEVKLPSGLTANGRAEVHVDHAASLRIAVVFDVPADAPAGWVRGSVSLTFPGMRVTEERMLHGWLAEPPK
jgi:hypothetical protein